jgi:hypothetical protein
MVELKQSRIIVSVAGIKFEGGALQQRPPYVLLPLKYALFICIDLIRRMSRYFLVVELPILDERML